MIDHKICSRAFCAALVFSIVSLFHGHSLAFAVDVDVQERVRPAVGNQQEGTSLIESETFKVIVAIIVVAGLIMAAIKYGAGLVTRKEVRGLVSSERRRFSDEMKWWHTASCKLIDFQRKGFERLFDLLLEGLKEEGSKEVRQRIETAYEQLLLESAKLRFVLYLESNDPALVDIGLRGVDSLADVGAIPKLEAFIRDYKGDDDFKHLVEMAKAIRDRIIRRHH